VEKDGIRITFRRAPEKGISLEVTVAETKVLFVISEGIATTVEEISSASGPSPASVRRAVNPLIEKRMIIRVGSDKTGSWVRK